MRVRCLVIATLIVFSAAESLWAETAARPTPGSARVSASSVASGPFTEVQSGHWAYAVCAHLSEMGLIADRPTSFSGSPLLSRFEFGVTILTPLSDVDRAIAALPPNAAVQTVLNATARALKLNPRASEKEAARAASDLRRLAAEFSGELRALNFDPTRATRALETLSVEGLRSWRAEALATPLRGLALAPAIAPADSFRVPVGHGTVALTYDRAFRPPGMLDYFASVAAERGAKTDGATAAEPALRDPQVSRVRTAYEYGIGRALTLSLAYEEIARSGQGLEPLDSASLASLGIGYRVTPSTSVKLSYSLLEYSTHVFDSPTLRDRVAETAVSIGF